MSLIYTCRVDGCEVFLQPSREERQDEMFSTGGSGHLARASEPRPDGCMCTPFPESAWDFDENLVDCVACCQDRLFKLDLYYASNDRLTLLFKWKEFLRHCGEHGEGMHCSC